MEDFVHRAIWYLRREKGVRISRMVERYIVEELEEDLFPYGFGDGGEDTVLRLVWDFALRVNAGEININKPFSERVLERYEALKESHLLLLWERNRERYGGYDETPGDDLPF